ncbi:hypothetical protein AVEN_235748-1 [Araneus ventricosus]|uniref:K Homology domain-containing protein n=1 Tax=Araneus ventricosus TaxID=182803 RepID=A0A4Y2R9W8_ARAVE|nr:hypothetical protein AVEN_123375-1 [Araneus ventricosus]GBN72570.1 hypothetical protein AVEN_235748-1 [Araneus ventricosus]
MTCPTKNRKSAPDLKADPLRPLGEVLRKTVANDLFDTAGTQEVVCVIQLLINVLHAENCLFSILSLIRQTSDVCIGPKGKTLRALRSIRQYMEQ